MIRHEKFSDSLSFLEVVVAVPFKTTTNNVWHDVVEDLIVNWMGLNGVDYWEFLKVAVILHNRLPLVPNGHDCSSLLQEWLLKVLSGGIKALETDCSQMRQKWVILQQARTTNVLQSLPYKPWYISPFHGFSWGWIVLTADLAKAWPRKILNPAFNPGFSCFHFFSKDLIDIYALRC